MPPLCYALIEDSYGSTTVEPVVVTRNPRNEDDMAARSAHPTQQFMRLPQDGCWLRIATTKIQMSPTTKTGPTSRCCQRSRTIGAQVCFFVRFRFVKSSAVQVCVPSTANAASTRSN